MAEAAKPKSKRNLFSLRTAILAVPAIAVLLAVFFIFGSGAKLLGKGGSAPAPAAEKRTELPEATIDLGEFIVNLEVPSGAQPRYAKVVVVVAVESEADAEYVKTREAFFKDVIVERFAQSSAADLNKIEGRTAIRESLQEELTEMMPEGKEVEKVLFTQLAFQ